MLILALELSSDVGSVAVMDGTRIVGEESWTQSRRDGGRLFAAWAELLRRAQLNPSRIELYACGRGPGMFSGIRAGLAAVRAAALPGGAPVIAVSSAEALAGDVMDRAGLDRVVVAGDARRDSLWWGSFRRRGERTELVGDWQTTSPADLPEALPAGVPIASPQWPRLQQILDPDLLASLPWIRQEQVPAASTVGRLAMFRRRDGAASDPLTPLYLHPAVRPS